MTWKDVIKNALTALGALALVALVTWLTGGADKILGWMTAKKIKAESISRGEVSSFLADEMIRFSLQGVQTNRVVWWFDEAEMQAGDVQIEHAFPFDSQKRRGILSQRRVDVFFREGASYYPVSTYVSVSNLPLASANVQGKAITLSPEDSDWHLCDFVVAHYSDGVFKVGDDDTSLKWLSGSSTPHLGGCSVKPVSLDLATLRRSGVAFGSPFDPSKSRRFFLLSRFRSADGGRTVETALSLDPQLAELQKKSGDNPN